MKLRLLAILLLAASPVLANTPFTAIHPEAAIPDPDSRLQSGPFSDLYVQVQERLNALGYDAGPPNGDFGAKTQAALAQFQLSIPLPASGQLDDATLAHLGVRDYPIDASAGSTAEGSAEPEPN
jgi:peptidoglycan hydrolase-like protein with peptidoglycan-binding domain